MSRILPKALNDKAEYFADRIEPVMRDAFFRMEGLDISYDDGAWEAILAAVTEKLPKRLGTLPISKDDKLELLAMIDAVDRAVIEKGPKATAEMLIKAMISMFDMFDAFRKVLNLRVKQDGNDITNEIFGHSAEE